MTKNFSMVCSTLAGSSFSTNDITSYLLKPVQLGTETQFEIRYQKINDELIEVILTTTVSAIEDETKNQKYHLSVSCSGLFSLSGFEGEEFNKLIKTHASSMLYPFCRAQVANILSQSAFPVAIIPTVNFFHLYENELQQALLKEESELEQE